MLIIVVLPWLVGVPILNGYLERYVPAYIIQHVAAAKEFTIVLEYAMSCVLTSIHPYQECLMVMWRKEREGVRICQIAHTKD